MKQGRVARPAISLAILTLLGPACATQRSHLDRAQRHYEENEYEQALLILEILEPERLSLTDTERSRYAYLRGITELRLQNEGEARHWLALAVALGQLYPDSLPKDWEVRAAQVLAQLNERVFEDVKRRRIAPDTR